MTLTIWHNPRCSKSRQTLGLLEERGLTPTIKLYLEDAPSEAEIKSVLGMLNIEARNLMRRGEADYKDQALDTVADSALLVKAMHNTPKLIERPVVINGTKAALGRPPEAVLDIL